MTLKSKKFFKFYNVFKNIYLNFFIILFNYNFPEAVTHMEQYINRLSERPVGARQGIEFYVRSFYREVCLDPLLREDKCRPIPETLFWLKRILRSHSMEIRVKLLFIIFGPLITVPTSPLPLPYIGWWDLTDTFFIDSGLEDLGFVFYMLFNEQKTETEKQSLKIFFNFKF